MTAPAPISFDGNVAARLAPTNFHLPPGANANFQQVAPGQVTPQTLGLLLWGATEQAETSPVGTDGMPLLSGEVMQHADYPAAANGGKPNPELLAIQFKAGDKVGLYRPTVELIGGNAVQFTIEAKVP